MMVNMKYSCGREFSFLRASRELLYDSLPGGFFILWASHTERRNKMKTLLVALSFMLMMAMMNKQRDGVLHILIASMMQSTRQLLIISQYGSIPEHITKT
jgi:hypothetical protein